MSDGTKSGYTKTGKKVKSIYDGRTDLTYNDVYEVFIDSDGDEFIIDDVGDKRYGNIDDDDYYELVDDVSNEVNDTNKPKPKFKVGDKVYVGMTGRIAQVTEIIDDEVVSVANENNSIRVWTTNICHATQENYELLTKLYPHIEFEQPAKELKGSDLARALIKKGWVGFNCLCGNSGDGHVITHAIVTGINNSGQFTTVDGRLFNNAVPMLGSFPLTAEQVGL